MRLIVLDGPWKGIELALDQQEHAVGRDPTCDFPIPDKALSRRHARFIPGAQGWIVEDLGSANGTEVNGTRITRHDLRAGDIVALGRNVFRFDDIPADSLYGGPTSVSRLLAIAPVEEPAGLGVRDPDALTALLALADSLSCADGLDELGATLAAWLVVRVDGRDAVLYRRKAGRLVAIAARAAPEQRRGGRGLALPREAIALAAARGKAVWLEVEAPARSRLLVVPVGVPADLIVAVTADNAPSTEELRLLACAGHLAAGFLQTQVRAGSLPRDGDAAAGESELVAASPSMRSVLEFVERAAPSDATVLISGESGAGKEVVARAIHRASGRAAGPFVGVNCAAMPESLLESELFGYEKGAFTGATARKPGRFELAERGTLLIDEIGDLPPQAQVGLLRVLEERAIHRLGGTSAIPVDVRVLAATHRDLKADVAAGRFRQDLYFRISVLVVVVSPLRERPEDIVELANRFLHRARGHAGRVVSGFAPAALEALRVYLWPGNVRELRNVVDRAVILGRTERIGLEDLPAEIAAARGGGPIVESIGLPVTSDELERRNLTAALRAAGGNKTQAARLLGVSRLTLYNRLKAYDIDADEADS